MTKKRSTAEAIRAPERLNVEHAAAFRTVLEAHAEGHDTTRIDLEAVTGIDTAGLQLLVVMNQDLAARGKVCELSNVPECVADSARLLGVDGWLELA